MSKDSKLEGFFIYHSNELTSYFNGKWDGEGILITKWKFERETKTGTFQNFIPHGIIETEIMS